MKRHYEAPYIDVFHLTVFDIITTSLLDAKEDGFDSDIIEIG